MWLKLEIDRSYIKRETEKAYQLICPNRSRFEGYRFWVPKKWVQFIRQGGLEYVQLQLESSMQIELKRFVSKRTPPLLKRVSAYDVLDCFRLEQDRINLRKYHMFQNQQADYWFEKAMRK